MNINNIRMFVKVVEAGNIARASERFDIPRATLSRNLKQLEDDLGIVLIARTTRKNQLTEAGELFYLKVKTIIADFDDLEKQIATENRQLSGRLTFAMPSLFTRLGCADMVDFAHQYPGLQLAVKNMELGLDTGMDFNFDFAMQLESPSDSSFHQVPLAELYFDYFASVDYLDRVGEPQDYKELHDHQCIFSPIKMHESKSWHFGNNSLKPDFVAVFDTHELAAMFARQGVGVCCVPVLENSGLLNPQKLVPLFKGKYRFKKTVFGVYPANRHMPIKLQILLERLKVVLPETFAHYEQF